MPDYKKGKVYMLCSDVVDSIYVGSTSMELDKRLSLHKSSYKRFLSGDYKYTTSFDLFKHGKVTIRLIEECPCESRKDLEKREGYWIKEMRDLKRNVLNKNTAGVGRVENNTTYMREYMRKYNAKKKLQKQK